VENEGGNTKTNFKVYIFSPSFTSKINETCIFVIGISCENVTPTLVGTLIPIHINNTTLVPFFTEIS